MAASYGFRVFSTSVAASIGSQDPRVPATAAPFSSGTRSRVSLFPQGSEFWVMKMYREGRPVEKAGFMYKSGRRSVGGTGGAGRGSGGTGRGAGAWGAGGSGKGEDGAGSGKGGDGAGSGKSGGGAGNGNGGSGRGDFGWALFYKFWQVIGALLASAVGVITTLYARNQYEVAKKESDGQNIDVQTQRGVDYIRKSVVEKVDDDRIIPRTQVIDAILSSVSDDRTELVYGCRGTGKTTALNVAFKGQGGVLMVQMNTDTHTSVYEALMVSLRIQLPSGYSAKALVQRVLEQANEDGRTRPIIIINIDERCRFERLREIFLCCKEFGFEKKLAKFFLDVSASHVIPFMGIDVFSLRARKLEVKDLTEKEATMYLLRVLRENKTRLSLLEGQLSSVVEYAINRVGTRVYTLRCLAGEISRCSGAEQIGICIDTFADERQAAARVSLINFLDYIDPQRRGDFLSLLSEMVNGRPFDLAEVATIAKLKQKVLLHAGVLGTPHVFIVDPFSLNVSLASFEMKNAIERLIRK